MFSWIPIYRQISKKVLAYKDKQPKLIEIISELNNGKKKIPTIRTTETDESGKEIPLAGLDGFTFFANFNRGITDENRIAIITRLKEIWELEAEIPTDFSGIPLVDNQRSWFFSSADKREKEDIGLLWKLYEELCNDEVQEDTFNKVRQIKGVKRNITMGFFWIRPDQYINLDKINEEALFKDYKIKASYGDYKSYMETVNEAKKNLDKIDKSFYQFSYDAWIAPNKKDKSQKEKTSKPPHQSSHDEQSIDKERRLTNLPLNLILYGPPGTGKTHKIEKEYIPLFTKTRSECLSEIAEDRHWTWYKAIALTLLDYKEIAIDDIINSEPVQIKLKNSKTENIHETIHGELQEHANQECPHVKFTRRSEPYIFWKKQEQEVES